MKREKIYLSFGGNIGEVEACILEAIDRICAIENIELCTQSSFWLTEPQSEEDQAWFVNCVASFYATGIEPHLLLEKTKEIEYSLGRKRILGIQNAPRTIDIDILDFASRKYEDKDLILPHQRMFERAFVLVPLCEISPEYSYNSKSIREYLEAIEYRVCENKIYQSYKD